MNDSEKLSSLAWAVRMMMERRRTIGEAPHSEDDIDYLRQAELKVQRLVDAVLVPQPLATAPVGEGGA